MTHSISLKHSQSFHALSSISEEPDEAGFKEEGKELIYIEISLLQSRIREKNLETIQAFEHLVKIHRQLWNTAGVGNSTALDVQTYAEIIFDLDHADSESIKYKRLLETHLPKPISIEEARLKEEKLKLKLLKLENLFEAFTEPTRSFELQPPSVLLSPLLSSSSFRRSRTKDGPLPETILSYPPLTRPCPLEQPSKEKSFLKSFLQSFLHRRGAYPEDKRRSGEIRSRQSGSDIMEQHRIF